MTGKVDLVYEDGQRGPQEETASAACLSTVPLIGTQKFYIEACRGGRVDVLITLALRLRGALKTRILEEALRQLVRRHESLRTRVVDSGGGLVNRVEELRAFNLVIQEFSDPNESDGEVEARARTYVEELASRGCDFDREPLFGTRLLRLGNELHVLVISIHHFITDGISCIVMCRDLWRIYAALVLGRQLPAQSGSVQFSEYRRWQEGALRAQAQKCEAFWNEYLAGASPIRWPNERHRAGNAQVVEVAQFELGESVCKALRQLAQRTRTLLSLEALAMCAAAISSVCSQRDFVMTTSANGRDRRDHDETTGYLAHPVFLRMQLAGQKNVSELLTHVRQEYTRTLFHRDFGDVVVNRIDLMGRTIVNWYPWRPEQLEGIPEAADAELLDVEVEAFPFSKPRSYAGGVDCIISCFESPRGICGYVMYRDSAISRDTVDCLLQAMRAAAEQLAVYA